MRYAVILAIFLGGCAATPVETVDCVAHLNYWPTPNKRHMKVHITNARKAIDGYQLYIGHNNPFWGTGNWVSASAFDGVVCKH